MFGFIKRMKRGRSGTNVVILLLCAILVFSTFPSILTADVKVNSTMRHTPPAFFVSEHRIQLDARVSDPSGVELVRCYFKAAGEADYVFVSMVNTGGNDYSGILPAPSPATEEIEYLFLMVNAENKIVKSQTFVIQSQEGEEAPSWQDIPQEGDIQVSMELDQLPAEVPGFSDSIVMDQVESGLRFGVVAGGLYLITATKTAGTSGAAASATSVGTVTATSTGMSTAFLVGAGVAGAAATGGLVAASTGSSSSGSSSRSGNIDSGSDLPGGTGDVKVTLQWNNCNDLDLIVTDPCGNEIYFGNRSATCQGLTGTLDIDANASGCETSSPAENIFWATAPRGRYTVEVLYFDQYHSSQSSSYTVTTIVGGSRRTYSGTISSGRRTITSFDN